MITVKLHAKKAMRLYTSIKWWTILNVLINYKHMKEYIIIMFLICLFHVMKIVNIGKASFRWKIRKF